MRVNFFLYLLWMQGVMTGLGGSAMAATYSATPCVSLTEIAAADSLPGGTRSPLMLKGGSYRVSEVRWDPVLEQGWAMIASCDHPEQPAFAVQTAGAIAGREAVRRKDESVPVVRAGDVVHLWRQEDNLRIEMTAMSEENGGLGKAIRVRLVGGDAAERQFVGIIRGIADVEMQR